MTSRHETMRDDVASSGSKTPVDASIAHAAPSQAASDPLRSPPPVHHTDEHPRHLHAGGTGFLALTALGIAFGDIGTSPLYAFSVALSAIGQAAPSAGDVLGLVSLIFWA